MRPSRSAPAALAGLLAAAGPLGVLAAPAASAAPSAGHPITVVLLGKEPEARYAWSRGFWALPAQKLQVAIDYRNTGRTVQRNVVIRLGLARGIRTVGRAYLRNSLHPNNFPASVPMLIHNGIRIGDYAPGANAVVTVTVQLPAVGFLRCGNNDFKSAVAAGVPGLGTATNALHVDVKRACPTSTGSVPLPA